MGFRETHLLAVLFQFTNWHDHLRLVRQSLHQEDDPVRDLPLLLRDFQVVYSLVLASVLYSLTARHKSVLIIRPRTDVEAKMWVEMLSGFAQRENSAGGGH